MSLRVATVATSAAACALSLLVAAGCTKSAGDDGFNPGGENNAGPTGGPIPAGLVNPCSLLTTAEVSTMGGTTVLDGTRGAEEDGTYVTCRWYATDDDLKIAPIVSLDLYPITDQEKDNVDQYLLGGQAEVLPGVGTKTAIQAADLGTTGNSGVIGFKGGVYYRLQCNPPTNKSKHAKAICTAAVTALASRLK